MYKCGQLFGILLLGLLPAASLTAQEGPLVREAFEYATLSPLNWAGVADGDMWLSDWRRANGDDILIRKSTTANSSDMSGHYLAVDFQWVGTRYNRAIPDIPDQGQVLWASYVMDIKPGANPNNVANITLTWNDQQIFTFGRKYGNQKFGMVWPGATNYNSDVDTEGPHWVVARIDFSGDSGTEQAWLWIDPDPQSEPDPADADLVVPQSGQPQLIIPGINGVQIKAEGNPPLRMDMDEVRLGESFAAVNPFLTTSVKTPFEAAKFVVFPNPAQNYLMLEIQEPDVQVRDLRLIAPDGRLIMRWPGALFPAASETYYLPWAGLKPAPGIYILQLLSDRGVSSRQVVIR